MLILLSFCMILLGETEYAQPEPSFDNPRKIIFSVTEDSEHAIDHILSTANNVIKFYGADYVNMEIVAYSKGIKVLLKKNKEIAKRVDALMQVDVSFVACGNTMRTKNIKKEDLVEGSSIVTAGVVELLERVKGGWIYIKP